MNKTYKIISSLGLIISLIVVSGCQDFLDINDDPNNPTSVPLSQLLPTVEARIARGVSLEPAGLSNITSSFTHQIVQRGNLNDYILLGTTFGVTAPWDIFYMHALTDIREIINIGTANEDWKYVGVAQILRAYTMSVIVDMWGTAPFTEANQGAANFSPKYDKGEDIYDALFAMLDEGVENLKKESNPIVANVDLIYGGDIDKWERFANTLKLKMYNQIRGVRNVSTEINALLTSAKLIESSSQDFELPYGTSANPDDRNPAYANEYTRGSRTYQMNPYFYEVLKGKDTFGHGGNIFNGIEDPRIPYYFYNQLQPGEEPENPPAYYDETTGFLGIYAFSFNIDPNEGYDQGSSMTVLGLYPCGGKFDDGSGETVDFNGVGNVAQRMLTFFSRKFIEAELALAGVTGGDHEALLRDAIVASFGKVNEIANNAGAPAITAATRDTYIDAIMNLYNNANNQGKLQIIMTQKWIANFGYGIDSYNDYRRTGFPVLHDGNTDNLEITVRGRDFPVSFPYPTEELQLNINSPRQRNVYMDRVFWHK